MSFYPVIDAQVYYQSHEVLLDDSTLKSTERASIAVELVIASMNAVGVPQGIWVADTTAASMGAERYPERLAGVVQFFDPIPDEAAIKAKVAEIQDHPHMHGIRLTPAWPPTGENIRRLSEGGYDHILQAAMDADLTVSLFMFNHLPAIPDLARRYPDLRLVVDHLGMPPRPFYSEAGDPMSAFDELIKLANYPNVAVKFTGAPSLSAQTYPFSDMWPYFHRLADAFGVSRLMWGSDFKRVSPMHNYAEQVRFATDNNELSSSEQAMFLRNAALSWFKINSW
jgi:predicted TIM-barrel fold metal-dependent hydrolase